MAWLSNKDLKAMLANSTRDARYQFIAEHFGLICPHLNLLNFEGVFASDMLPPHKHGARMLVVNSDPRFKAGQHWLAFYQSKDNVCEIFDSMGRPIHCYPDINNWLRDVIKPPCSINNYRIQGPNGLCGAYCYYYLTRRPHTSDRETVFFPEHGPPFTAITHQDEPLLSEADIASYLRINDDRVYHYFQNDLDFMTRVMK